MDKRHAGGTTLSSRHCLASGNPRVIIPHSAPRDIGHLGDSGIGHLAYLLIQQRIILLGRRKIGQLTDASPEKV
jgi:hypothetical protein